MFSLLPPRILALSQDIENDGFKRLTIISQANARARGAVLLRQGLALLRAEALIDGLQFIFQCGYTSKRLVSRCRVADPIQLFKLLMMTRKGRSQNVWPSV